MSLCLCVWIARPFWDFSFLLRVVVTNCCRLLPLHGSAWQGECRPGLGDGSGNEISNLYSWRRFRNKNRFGRRINEFNNSDNFFCNFSTRQFQRHLFSFPCKLSLKFIQGRVKFLPSKSVCVNILPFLCLFFSFICL